jgi:hypothetical protein
VELEERLRKLEETVKALEKSVNKLQTFLRTFLKKELPKEIAKEYIKQSRKNIEKLKPPAIGFWDWICQPPRNFSKRQYYNLTASEQKKLRDEFYSCFPSGFVSIGFGEWLAQEKDLAMEQLAKMSNEDKKRLWEEWFRYKPVKKEAKKKKYLNEYK